MASAAVAYKSIAIARFLGWTSVGYVAEERKDKLINDEKGKK